MKGLVARLAVLESGVKKPRAKKVKSASDEEKEPRPPTPWQELLTRVRALLKDHEEAKTAVGSKGVFSFCSHLKGECDGNYDTLTDKVILENAVAWVVPAAKKPVAEAEPEEAEAEAPKAKTPVKKPAAPAAAPSAPKKVAKKGKASESED